MRLKAGAWCVFFVTVALGAAWLAMSIPMHFRAISPLVLEEAAKGTPTLESLAWDFVDAEELGPAEMLRAASAGELRDEGLGREIRRLRADHPEYIYSGGPAPYYEQWLKRVGILEAGAIEPPVAPAAVLPLLLPRERRQVLRAFLEQSSNRTVEALLHTRELEGYQRFLPVFSAGGHPLDATILITALLEQSDVWSPQMSRFLRDQAALAAQDPTALAQLENTYLAILTLGSRLNWGQMAALLPTISAPDELNDLNAAFQLAGDRGTELYAAMLLSGDSVAISRYLLKRREEGWRVMSIALSMGKGALVTMIDFNQPLYDPPAFLAKLPRLPGQATLREFTERQPQPALMLKSLALVLAGYLLALALENFVRLFLKPHPHPRGLAVHAFHFITGLGLAALVWIVSEPKLLEFEPNEGGTLRIQLANVLPMAQAESAIESTMIDQVTLLVLILFFVLQGIVFVFSLIKIKEIRGQALSPAVKLRLLENEENLFDLGLYVGLGGTVSSLLLIVLEFVDASLMAAYASTLFGIIFVAVLKVMVLRPYRRRLILEANQASIVA